jgi:hypothetical protein
MKPEAARVFSFTEDELNEKLYTSPTLMRHATFYMRMIERAVDLLGPDIEHLSEMLVDLGRAHFKLGVQAEFYPPMGKALIKVFRKFLGDKFTPEMKTAWQHVYQILAYDMIRAGREANIEDPFMLYDGQKGTFDGRLDESRRSVGVDDDSYRMFDGSERGGMEGSFGTLDVDASNRSAGTLGASASSFALLSPGGRRRW